MPDAGAGSGDHGQVLQPHPAIAPTDADLHLASTLMRVVEWTMTPSEEAVWRLACWLAEDRAARALLDEAAR